MAGHHDSAVAPPFDGLVFNSICLPRVDFIARALARADLRSSKLNQIGGILAHMQMSRTADCTEPIAMHAPFGPIEGRKWFIQI